MRPIPFLSRLKNEWFFSRDIIRRFNPSKVNAVAICGKGDVEMKAICAAHNIEAWGCPERS